MAQLTIDDLAGVFYEEQMRSFRGSQTFGVPLTWREFKLAWPNDVQCYRDGVMAVIKALNEHAKEAEHERVDHR